MRHVRGAPLHIRHADHHFVVVHVPKPRLEVVVVEHDEHRMLVGERERLRRKLQPHGKQALHVALGQREDDDAPVERPHTLRGVGLGRVDVRVRETCLLRERSHRTPRVFSGREVLCCAFEVGLWGALGLVEHGVASVRQASPRGGRC